MAGSMKVDTPEAMRALAHPLRLRILYQLEIDGHGRAADLARALDVPANAVSFHLRTLAKAGLIVEAPELARDKRNRVWRNTADTYDVAPGTPGMEVLTRQYVAWFRRAITEPDEVRTVRLAQLPLSADEARELSGELDAVLERWAQRALDQARAEPATPRRLHNVVVAVGPTEPPGTPEPGDDPEPAVSR